MGPRRVLASSPILDDSAEVDLPVVPCSAAAAMRAWPEKIYEAHISAQETQACPCTRVSRSYAHAGGSAHAQAAPQQGPQAPVGVEIRQR